MRIKLENKALQDMNPFELEQEINYLNDNEKQKERYKNLEEYYHNCFLDFVRITIDDIKKYKDIKSRRALCKLFETACEKDLNECNYNMTEFVELCLKYYQVLNLDLSFISCLAEFLIKCEEYDKCLNLIKQYIVDIKKYKNILEKEFEEYENEYELFFFMCKILYLQGKYDSLSEEEKKDYINEEILKKYDSYTDYLYLKSSDQAVEEDLVLPDFDSVVEKIENGEMTTRELNEILEIDENEINIRKNKDNYEIIDYENVDYNIETVIHFLMFVWNKSYNDIKKIRTIRMV